MPDFNSSIYGVITIGVLCSILGAIAIWSCKKLTSFIPRDFLSKIISGYTAPLAKRVVTLVLEKGRERIPTILLMQIMKLQVSLFLALSSVVWLFSSTSGVQENLTHTTLEVIAPIVLLLLSLWHSLRYICIVSMFLHADIEHIIDEILIEKIEEEYTRAADEIFGNMVTDDKVSSMTVGELSNLKQSILDNFKRQDAKMLKDDILKKLKKENIERIKNPNQSMEFTRHTPGDSVNI